MGSWTPFFTNIQPLCFGLGNADIDKIISERILLNRQSWSYGPRRPSSKAPRRRMSTSAMRDQGNIDCNETLESTLQQLKLLSLGSEADFNNPSKEHLDSAALNLRRQSVPGNVKLSSTKTSNGKRQDILTIVEEKENHRGSKVSKNKISKKTK